MKTRNLVFALIASVTALGAGAVHEGIGIQGSSSDWSGFESAPPVSREDAISVARDFLIEKEKLNRGIWRLAETDDESARLILNEKKQWVWRVDFIYEPSDVWSGPIPARSLIVSMDGTCRYTKQNKKGPNNAVEPTPVDVTIPAAQEVAPSTSAAHLGR